MKTFFLTAVVFAGCSAGSICADTSTTYWSHNESIMVLSDEGNAVAISYLVPRFGMRNVGVSKGTVLFQGRDDGHELQGKAFFFQQ